MNRERVIAKLRAKHGEQDTRGFNAFDFVHAFGSGREALMYAGLFWPEFVELDDMVFLKSSIESEDDKRRLNDAFKRYDSDRTKTELSFNVVEVPTLFGRRMAETDEDEDQWLAEFLREMWQIRLQLLFPKRTFLVEILELDDVGSELSVRFYQSAPSTV